MFYNFKFFNINTITDKNLNEKFWKTINYERGVEGFLENEPYYFINDNRPIYHIWKNTDILQHEINSNNSLWGSGIFSKLEKSIKNWEFLATLITIENNEIRILGYLNNKDKYYYKNVEIKGLFEFEFSNKIGYYDENDILKDELGNEIESIEGISIDNISKKFIVYSGMAYINGELIKNAVPTYGDALKTIDDMELYQTSETFNVLKDDYEKFYKNYKYYTFIDFVDFRNHFVNIEKEEISFNYLVDQTKILFNENASVFYFNDDSSLTNLLTGEKYNKYGETQYTSIVFSYSGESSLISAENTGFINSLKVIKNESLTVKVYNSLDKFVVPNEDFFISFWVKVDENDLNVVAMKKIFSISNENYYINIEISPQDAIQTSKSVIMMKFKVESGEYTRSYYIDKISDFVNIELKKIGNYYTLYINGNSTSLSVFTETIFDNLWEVGIFNNNSFTYYIDEFIFFYEVPTEIRINQYFSQFKSLYNPIKIKYKLFCNEEKESPKLYRKIINPKIYKEFNIFGQKINWQLNNNQYEVNLREQIYNIYLKYSSTSLNFTNQINYVHNFSYNNENYQIIAYDDTKIVIGKKGLLNYELNESITIDIKDLETNITKIKFITQKGDYLFFGTDYGLYKILISDSEKYNNASEFVYNLISKINDFNNQEIFDYIDFNGNLYIGMRKDSNNIFVKYTSDGTTWNNLTLPNYSDNTPMSDKWDKVFTFGKKKFSNQDKILTIFLENETVTGILNPRYEILHYDLDIDHFELKTNYVQSTNWVIESQDFANYTLFINSDKNFDYVTNKFKNVEVTYSPDDIIIINNKKMVISNNFNENGQFIKWGKILNVTEDYSLYKTFDNENLFSNNVEYITSVFSLNGNIFYIVKELNENPKLQFFHLKNGDKDFKTKNNSTIVYYKIINSNGNIFLLENNLTSSNEEKGTVELKKELFSSSIFDTPTNMVLYREEKIEGTFTVSYPDDQDYEIDFNTLFQTNVSDYKFLLYESKIETIGGGTVFEPNIDYIIDFVNKKLICKATGHLEAGTTYKITLQYIVQESIIEIDYIDNITQYYKIIKSSIPIEGCNYYFSFSFLDVSAENVDYQILYDEGSVLALNSTMLSGKILIDYDICLSKYYILEVNKDPYINLIEKSVTFSNLPQQKEVEIDIYDFDSFQEFEGKKIFDSESFIFYNNEKVDKNKYYFINYAYYKESNISLGQTIPTEIDLLKYTQLKSLKGKKIVLSESEIYDVNTNTIISQDYYTITEDYKLILNNVMNYWDNRVINIKIAYDVLKQKIVLNNSNNYWNNKTFDITLSYRLQNFKILTSSEEIYENYFVNLRTLKGENFSPISTKTENALRLYNVYFEPGIRQPLIIDMRKYLPNFVIDQDTIKVTLAQDGYKANFEVENIITESINSYLRLDFFNFNKYNREWNLEIFDFNNNFLSTKGRNYISYNIQYSKTFISDVTIEGKAILFNSETNDFIKYFYNSINDNFSFLFSLKNYVTPNENGYAIFSLYQREPDEIQPNNMTEHKYCTLIIKKDEDDNYKLSIKIGFKPDPLEFLEDPEPVVPFDEIEFSGISGSNGLNDLNIYEYTSYLITRRLVKLSETTCKLYFDIFIVGKNYNNEDCYLKDTIEITQLQNSSILYNKVTYKNFYLVIGNITDSVIKRQVVSADDLTSILENEISFIEKGINGAIQEFALIQYDDYFSENTNYFITNYVYNYIEIENDIDYLNNRVIEYHKTVKPLIDKSTVYINMLNGKNMLIGSSQIPVSLIVKDEIITKYLTSDYVTLKYISFNLDDYDKANILVEKNDEIGGTSIVFELYDNLNDYFVFRRNDVKTGLKNNLIEIGKYVKVGEGENERVVSGVIINTNLIVTGETISQSSSNLEVSNSIIFVNKGETGNGITKGYAGLIIDKGLAGMSSLLFNESNDTWFLSGFNYDNEIETPIWNQNEKFYVYDMGLQELYYTNVDNDGNLTKTRLLYKNVNDLILQNLNRIIIGTSWNTISGISPYNISRFIFYVENSSSIFGYGSNYIKFSWDNTNGNFLLFKRNSDNKIYIGIDDGTNNDLINLTTSSIIIKSGKHLLPYESNSNNLGGVNNKWKDLYLNNSIILNNGTNEVNLLNGSGVSLRIQNANGYGELGPQNSNCFHFYTDRTFFYFDKTFYINGSLLNYNQGNNDLGGINNKWRNLHLFGNAYIDTNTFIGGVLTVTGTTKTSGAFYAGTTVPSNATRLNYDGALYTYTLNTINGLFVNSTEVIDSSSNIKNINSIGLTPSASLPNHFPATDGRYKNIGFITGTIKIKLPPLDASTMLSFWVDIYNYSTNTSMSIFIAGYRFSVDRKWQNVSATIIGNENNLPVYFYYDPNDFTNAWVYIGNTNATWDYPQIIVRNAIAGHNGTLQNLATGWQITITNTFEGTLSQSVFFTSVRKTLFRNGKGDMFLKNYYGTGSSTGCIRIKTNIKFNEIWGDFEMSVLLSEEVTPSYIIDKKVGIEYKIFGTYDNNGVFSNLTLKRDGIKKYRIRAATLTADSTLVFLIGETGTNWNKVGVIVKDFYFTNVKGTGSSISVDNYTHFQNWTIDFITSLVDYGNVTHIRDDNPEIGIIKDCAVRYNIHNALFCDGSTISKTTNSLYTELVDILKAEAGADTSHPYYHADSDKAVLPNLLGKFTRGIDTTGSIDKSGTRKAGSYQADDNKSHTHTNSCGNQSANHTHAISLTSGAESSHTHSASTNSAGSHTHSITDPGHNHAVEAGASGSGFGMLSGHTSASASTDLNYTGISVNANGSHTHTVSVGAGSSHTHSVSGDTGTNSVNHNHTITINNTGDTEVTVKNVAVWKMIIF